ncbi:hypothetical protein WDV06_26490 [Streptomyces racemochromogenes]|uniref:Secreted protein/lipoprotein n=1 Tax=Streptomyces racemochromogenes TaxID=67353 RepID=A0ABW7PJN2_9ACTN
MQASGKADPQAAEKAAVLAAYAGMGAAEVRSYTSGTLDPDLERYATDAALADIKATLFWYQQRGTVMKGQPAHAPTVESVDTTGDPQRAVVSDCVDSTGYDKVDKASGQPAPAPSGPRRHVVTSTVQRTGSGPWLVYRSTIERDRTC